MRQRPKIVVVGSFNVDITGYANRLPRHGETVLGSAVTLGCGGKGFNQAVAAARSGAEVAMVAKIGTDELSAFAHEHFLKEGMTEKFVSRAPGVSTGAAFIEVDEQSGENRIIVVKSANGCMKAEDVLAAEEEIAQAGAVLTQLETSFESVRALLDVAMAKNKPVVLNPAPFQTLPEGFLRGVDYLTPNETEAEFYSGVKVEDEASASRAAIRMLQMGVKNVVITLGSKGAYFHTRSARGIIASPVMKAVDTTGAGDAFSGALTVALAEGKTLPEAIRFANCFAALSVTKRGTCDAMPRREEADALCEKTFAGIAN